MEPLWGIPKVAAGSAPTLSGLLYILDLPIFMRVWCVRCRVRRPLPRSRRRMECLCPASTACAPLRPNRASPCAERAGASVRTRMLAHPSGSASPNLPSASLRRISRQSEDCLRVRPPRSATALRKGRSAVGGDAARGWHGRVGGSGTARHSATADSAFPRDAQSIRECALHGLVGIPPCALQRRLAASCASRRRIRSGHVVIAAHPARAIRRMSAQALPLAPLDLLHTCASHFIGTSGAPCVPLVSPVPPVSPKARHP